MRKLTIAGVITALVALGMISIVAGASGMMAHRANELELESWEVTALSNASDILTYSSLFGVLALFLLIFKKTRIACPFIMMASIAIASIGYVYEVSVMQGPSVWELISIALLVVSTTAIFLQTRSLLHETIRNRTAQRINRS